MSVHYHKPRVCWFCKWRENGRERRRYFKTEGEARAFQSERVATLADMEERLSLGELVIKFFQARPDYHPVTRVSVVNFLKDGAGAFLRNKYAESLNRRDLEQMRQNLFEKGAGNNTVNKYQAYVRAILAWGVEHELIRVNPWRDFKRLKVKKAVFQPKVEDLRILYQYLPEYLQWAVKTAFCLALRPGQVELFSLTWEAFNWARGLVIVRQGKSGKIKSVVPPAAYMEEARGRFEKDMAAGIPLVCHRGGKKVLSFRTAWTTACRRAGVQMRPYDIRHIAATEMLARGADLAAVAAQLGHCSVATTGSVYAHVTHDGQSRAAALMPILGEGDTK